jgi:hypothetical protein
MGAGAIVGIFLVNHYSTPVLMGATAVTGIITGEGVAVVEDNAPLIR